MADDVLDVRVVVHEAPAWPLKGREGLRLTNVSIRQDEGAAELTFEDSSTIYVYVDAHGRLVVETD